MKTAPSHKTLVLHDFKALDDTTGKFSGYLSTFGNVDYGNDSVQPGAFVKTIREAKSTQSASDSPYLFPILWQHNPNEPIGGFVNMAEDAKGLYVEGELDMDIPQGQRAYSGLKKKYIRGMSIGYDTVKERWEKGVRNLIELRLWEGSIVTFPMNAEADVTTVKRRGAGKQRPIPPRLQKSVNDGGIAAVACLAQYIDDATDALVQYCDMLVQLLGIPDPDGMDNAALQTVSAAVAAVAGAEGVQDLARQLDTESDVVATAADNLLAALGIADDDDSDYSYGYYGGYMSAGAPDEAKVGRTFSAANEKALGDIADSLAGHATSMKGMLGGTYDSGDSKGAVQDETKPSTDTPREQPEHKATTAAPSEPAQATQDSDYSDVLAQLRALAN
jgi:HK97 family phage prohead protease